MQAPSETLPHVKARRTAPNAVRGPPRSGTCTGAYKHRLHKYLVLPGPRRTPGTEVAPLTPIGQPSFPWSTSGTHWKMKKTRSQTPVFNRVRQIFRTRACSLLMGCGQLHRFDRRRSVGTSAATMCGRNQASSRFHLRKVLLSLDIRRTRGFQWIAPMGVPKYGPILSVGEWSQGTTTSASFRLVL